MKHLLRLLLTALTLTAVLVSCNKTDEELTLTPSKITVTADGTDAVTFTVRQGDQDVTSSAAISVDGTRLTSNEFTTTTAGEYKITATYNGKTSNEVTVTATEAPAAALVLSVDKPSIIADGADKAVFTVTQDGVDVTANSNVCMPSGMCLISPEFTTEEAGEFEFYATLKDDDQNKSNTITVTATAAESEPLILSVDKTSIMADGVDKAVFTVTQDGVDVTDNSNVCMPSGVCLISPEFTTEEAGEYIFYATLKDDDQNKSNTITVTATAATGDAFYPNIAMIRFTNIGCGPCTNYVNNIFTPYILPIIEDNYVEMTVHTNFPSSSDPFRFTNYLALARAWGLFTGSSYGVPDGTFDMKWLTYGLYADAVSGSSINLEEMRNRFQDLVDTKVSDVGFHVTSSIADGTVTVNITVKSNKTDTYTLTVALLEDGLEGTQSGVSGTYIHDNTLRAMVTPVTGESLGEIVAGETVTKTYTLGMQSGWTAGNCKFFICATNDVDGKTLVNNACHATVEGTTPYRYK